MNCRKSANYMLKEKKHRLFLSVVKMQEVEIDWLPWWQAGARQPCRFITSWQSWALQGSLALRFELTLRASSSTFCHLRFHTLGCCTLKDRLSTPGGKLSFRTTSQSLEQRRGRMRAFCGQKEWIKQLLVLNQFKSKSIPCECKGPLLFRFWRSTGYHNGHLLQRLLLSWAIALMSLSHYTRTRGIGK